MGMGPAAADGVFMQRRMGAPAHGQAQDFLGAMPHTFPHLCSLCDFDVHSAMGWNQHSTGLRHSESRRTLLQIYPDWDPGTAPNRGSRSLMLETTNPSMGLLGDAPMTMGQQGGAMPSSWGGGAGGGPGKPQSRAMQPKIRSRVVVAKYDRKPLSNKSLFALAQPFGTLSEHLVLKSKAFLEMQTHKEALDMVAYYRQKPAVLYGKEITFYLSKELIAIEKDDRMDGVPRERKGRPSQVVFFSNLPREADKKMELLTIAKRFGTVEKHLFLNDEAFVQLGTPEDAEMLVKYYTLNPLTIKGRRVRLNICAKYKTLNVSRNRQAQGQGWAEPEGRTRKNSTSSSTGTRTPSSSSKAPKSASTAKGKEGKDSKEGKDDEPKPAEGSGDEVAGVMEGDEEEEGEGGDGGGADEVAGGDAQAEAEGADAEQANAESVPQDGEPEPEPEGVGGEKAESGGGGTEKGSGSGAGEQGNGPGEPEDGPAKTSAAPRETKEPEEGEEEEPGAKDAAAAAATTEPAETSDMADESLLEDQEGSMEDFPENMDDFVTLDELADEEDMDAQTRDSSTGKSKRAREMRVVNVTGFKRGHTFRSELLALAKPFGKVEKHLVLDLRPEAFLELSSEAEAKAMVQFYNGNVTPMVCGKPVRMYHSQTYPTIECGNSKVVYVGGIPHTKYSDSQILRIAEPFGKIRRFFLNRNRSECFIEMEHGEDAEKMAEAFRVNPPKFQNKRLTVYVSRKYKQLKYGHRPPGAPEEKEEKRPSKRERADGEEVRSSPAKAPAEEEKEEQQEPPNKKPKEDKLPAAEEIKKEPTEEEEEENEEKEKEKESGAEQPGAAVKEEAKEKAEQPSESCEEQKMDTDEVTKRVEETEVAMSTDVGVKNGEDQPTKDPQTPAAEVKPAIASLPLAPYDPSNPTGVEYVKMGYYCRVCFLFYSNEESAKKVHCSSQAHYDKLKKYLEKEKAKGKRVSL